jgi:small-conductance mechanosensitive channel
MNFLDQSFSGNTTRDWLHALMVAAAVLVGLRIVLWVVVNRLAALSQRTKTDWDDIIYHAVKKTRFAILLAAAVWAGSLYLDLSDTADARLRKAILVIGWIQVGIWASAGFHSWLDTYRERRLAKDASAAPVITAVGYAASVVLWSIVLLVVLDNLGVKVTTLLAGLGVGGIAVALALQNVLGDVFASLSIILDKPFVIGDYLTIGEHQGTVQRIGLKSTRMRSLSGEELVFSNNDLLASRIRRRARSSTRSRGFSAKPSRRSKRPGSTARTLSSTAIRQSFSRRRTSCSHRSTPSTWIFSRRSTSGSTNGSKRKGSSSRIRRRRSIWRRTASETGRPGAWPRRGDTRSNACAVRTTAGNRTARKRPLALDLRRPA